MTKHNVTVGKYWYSRPSWNEKVKVEVVGKDGELEIIFKKGYFHSPVKDCPEDAKFERIS